MGSALFEQTRERTGGLVTVQIKPTQELNFDITGFRSEMEARNYNRNFLVWGSRILGGGGSQVPHVPHLAPAKPILVLNLHHHHGPAGLHQVGFDPG